MVEVRLVDRDLLVAAGAAVVRDRVDLLTWEGCVAPDVGDHLPESDELVQQSPDFPRVDVALDAGCVLVGALGPRRVIRGHLMAPTAESRLVGRACDAEKRDDQRERRKNPDRCARGRLATHQPISNAFRHLMSAGAVMPADVRRPLIVTASGASPVACVLCGE